VEDHSNGLYKYACDIKLTGSTGNVYTITLRDGVLTCNCPDFKTMGSRTCCKHLAFVLIKVGRITETLYFWTRKLTAKEESTLKSRLKDVF
jgi:hypothetical protein